ncbi:MBL fold metallo-hydrolase [Congregibacter variabilis]|uniref:MBL fold metallo-hydrolase n=1 Tax=Congregibacter variabilis TaxID=3081200 RepID=A0ABZ0I8L2_9GAMM|nr:MBL fold metallo-hydrolase [Congregibacter sp. IMCC43200]
MASITSYGAAREVTGSCHLLESPACGRVLLDCGMHQGGDAVDRLHDERFAFDPASIDAVILSHAHLDHSGLLPRLCQGGFRGPILCTPATAELLRIMLHDAVGLYLRDLEYKNRRNARRGRPLIEASYGVEDVETALSACIGVEYRKHHSLGAGNSASICFHDAGHILGSAICEVLLQEDGQQKRLVFSGDLGKTDSVLMREPAQLQEADILLMESTYGDRDHRPEGDTLTELRDLLRETWSQGGNVMIPAFAVGRTQEILFHLGTLHHSGELDGWRVFLDSPMAISVTQVYDHWLKLLDTQDIRALDDAKKSSLAEFLPTLSLTPDTDQSMAINRIKGGAIIIAGSGMCTGGRIRHHFKHGIWQANNTIIFTGFQAQGTLGRLLVDGASHVRLFGEEYIVKARIATLGALSAHAGQQQLVDWRASFRSNPLTLLIHGEEKAQQVLADRLRQELDCDLVIPERGQSIEF